MQSVYSIFDLRRAYHASLSNMRGWLWDSALSARLTNLDRLSIMDAWHQEMIEFFERNGFCFSCSRRLKRCACPPEPGDGERQRPVEHAWSVERDDLHGRPRA